MGSMDGDIDDDCASEITNNDSLDDKDWKNEYLAAKQADATEERLNTALIETADKADTGK
jgi:hypothetical protein